MIYCPPFYFTFSLVGSCSKQGSKILYSYEGERWRKQEVGREWEMDLAYKIRKYCFIFKINLKNILDS